MANAVPNAGLVLVVCHGNAGAEGDQWLWGCIQHKGAQVRTPLQTILGTSHLELLYVDFTGIETMMKLDQPPNIVNVLVFCDHFMRHIMAYVTLDEMAKFVTKFLWQGYISIFGAPAKLLSDWKASFESNIISGLCKLMFIQKARTSLYHPRLTDRWIKLTKCWCRCLGNWVKMGR